MFQYINKRFLTQFQLPIFPLGICVEYLLKSLHKHLMNWADYLSQWDNLSLLNKIKQIIECISTYLTNFENKKKNEDLRLTSYLNNCTYKCVCVCL